MVPSGRSQHCRTALLALLLLLNDATAANLNGLKSGLKLGSESVLTDIQTEVNTMNKHLGELSTAIDGSSGPTPEPSPDTPTDAPTSDTPTDEPTSPTGQPTAAPDVEVSDNDNKLRRLFISRNFISLEVAADACDAYQDIAATLQEAQTGLDLVSDLQLSDPTLASLKSSNTKLAATTKCVNDGNIIITDADKTTLKASISTTEKHGKTASDTIDDIVSPPTPAPVDDSGFKSATIALGVLLGLSLVAVAGLAIVVRRRQTGV